MRKPNFFIAGPPKAGTTALYGYLSTHPQCYMPSVKEPNFFNDEDEGRHILDLETYHSLYQGATAQHRVLGDGSPLYLGSRSALRRIREYNPSAKIVVVLRYPVDMFFSLFQQNLFKLREDVLDPVRAWELQDMRKRGQHVPRGCRHPQMLQYREMISLGSQVSRLYQTFPQEQVLALSFNDFAERTAEVYERVLGFLGLESDGRDTFPRENSSKIHRSFWLARVLALNVYSRKPVFGQLMSRHQAGIKRRMVIGAGQVLDYLRLMNTRPWRPEIDYAFAARIGEEMASEVELVRGLTGIVLRSKHLDVGQS